MEYMELVSQIIAAEHSAQEIARDAEARKASLDADLARETASMREDYFARAKHRIALIEAEEAAGADADIAAWDKRLAAAMAAVESAYAKNRDTWAELLFNRIVGGAT